MPETRYRLPRDEELWCNQARLVRTCGDERISEGENALRFDAVPENKVLDPILRRDASVRDPPSGLIPGQHDTFLWIGVIVDVQVA